jgi:hypothetical protein
MAGFVECLDSEDAEEFVRLEEGMRQINLHFFFFYSVYILLYKEKNLKIRNWLMVIWENLSLCKNKMCKGFKILQINQTSITANQANYE